jgi:hypothetical protein
MASVASAQAQASADLKVFLSYVPDVRRGYLIPPEVRTYLIPAEARYVAVTAESRRVLVARETRSLASLI